MAENLLIFGAGASYGSESPGVPVPELMTNLFAKMCERHSYDGSSWIHIRDSFPGLADLLRPTTWIGDETHEEWSQMMRDLPRIFCEDFERAFEWLRLHEHQKTNLLMRDLARYFTSFEPTEESLYRKLFGRCSRSWSGAVATLNYDVLAQRAALAERVELDCPNTQRKPLKKSKKRIELCLPHGSASLFSALFRGAVYAEFSQIPAGRPHVIIDAKEWKERTENSNLLPVMALITSEKSADIGPEFIQQQKQRFKELIFEAKRIAIVGMNLHVADRHTWEPLAATSARILYCGGHDSAERFRVWASEYGRKQDVASNGYFVEHFEDICAHVGLSHG